MRIDETSEREGEEKINDVRDDRYAEEQQGKNVSIGEKRIE